MAHRHPLRCCSMPHMSRPTPARALLIIAALLLHSTGWICSATRIEWTPNESDSNGDNSGPLPLSMKQREQLLKLEQAIVQSPNPEATLEKVAQSKQMSPQELWSMLQRNRADLQQHQQLQGNPLSLRNNVLVKIVTSAAAAAGHAFKKHPRWFVTIVVVLLVSAHVAYHGPRNGVTLYGPSMTSIQFNGGPTTLMVPPPDYCRSVFLKSNAIPWDRATTADASPARSPLLLTVENLSDLFEPAVQRSDRDDDDDDEAKENELTFQWLEPKVLQQRSDGELGQAAMGRAVLTLDDLVPSSGSDLMRHRDVAPVLALEAARDVLRDQQLTEFSPKIRYHSRGERGVLVVPGMGDWGLVGLQPLRKAKEPLPPNDSTSNSHDDSDDESTMHLVLATVPGYHFEGEIHVVVSLDDSDNLSIETAVIIPTLRRSISKAVAKNIVNSITESLVKSIQTRTRQALSRSNQSAAFQRRSKEKAEQRRQSRQQKERELEEMATDRRRRWQRQNPNAGHYRPSGDRMRSPNNAVYR